MGGSMLRGMVTGGNGDGGSFENLLEVGEDVTSADNVVCCFFLSHHLSLSLSLLSPCSLGVGNINKP